MRHATDYRVLDLNGTFEIQPEDAALVCAIDRGGNPIADCLQALVAFGVFSMCFQHLTCKYGESLLRHFCYDLYTNRLIGHSVFASLTGDALDSMLKHVAGINIHGMSVLIKNCCL